jgi:hypothetical protein
MVRTAGTGSMKFDQSQPSRLASYKGDIAIGPGSGPSVVMIRSVSPGASISMNRTGADVERYTSQFFPRGAHSGAAAVKAVGSPPVMVSPADAPSRVKERVAVRWTVVALYRSTPPSIVGAPTTGGSRRRKVAPVPSRAIQHPRMWSTRSAMSSGRTIAGAGAGVDPAGELAQAPRAAAIAASVINVRTCIGRSPALRL